MMNLKRSQTGQKEKEGAGTKYTPADLFLFRTIIGDSFSFLAIVAVNYCCDCYSYLFVAKSNSKNIIITTFFRKHIEMTIWGRPFVWEINVITYSELSPLLYRHSIETAFLHRRKEQNRVLSHIRRSGRESILFRISPPWKL